MAKEKTGFQLPSLPPPPWERRRSLRYEEYEEAGKRDEIVELVGDASVYLKARQYDRAYWRLVDAAGLLRNFANITTTSIGTEGNPTGRGFYIGHTLRLPVLKPR